MKKMSEYDKNAIDIICEAYYEISNDENYDSILDTVFFQLDNTDEFNEYLNDIAIEDIKNNTVKEEETEGEGSFRSTEIFYRYNGKGLSDSSLEMIQRELESILTDKLFIKDLCDNLSKNIVMTPELVKKLINDPAMIAFIKDRYDSAIDKQYEYYDSEDYDADY